MAKKKEKAKKPKGKRIKVSKARKKPQRSKKRKGRKGQGQYSNLFPTNRQIDSNQYWQLRAEIAGAEARVRSSLKDRQDEESKAEKRAEAKVDKLEKQVEAVQQAQTPGTPAQPQQPQQPVTINFNNPGTPALDPGADDSQIASGNRTGRSPPVNPQYSPAAPEPAPASVDQLYSEYTANETTGSNRPQRSGLDSSAYSDISDHTGFQQRLDDLAQVVLGVPELEQSIPHTPGSGERTGSKSDISSVGIGDQLAKFGKDGGVEKYAQKRQEQHRADHSTTHDAARDRTPEQDPRVGRRGAQWGEATVEALAKGIGPRNFKTPPGTPVAGS